MSESVAIVNASDVDAAASALESDAGQHHNVAFPVQEVTHAEGDKEEADAIEMTDTQGPEATTSAEDGAAEAMEVDAGAASTTDAADTAANAEVERQDEEEEAVEEVADEGPSAADVPADGPAKHTRHAEEEARPSPARNTPAHDKEKPPSKNSAAVSTPSPARATRRSAAAAASSSQGKTQDEAIVIDDEPQAGGKKKRGGKASVAEQQSEPVEEEEEVPEEDEEEYEIEAILDHRKAVGKGHDYLVAWVGYGPDHNSWTHETNFGSNDLIQEYWEKKRMKPVAKASASASNSQRGKRKASEPAVEEPSRSRGRRSTNKNGTLDGDSKSATGFEMEESNDGELIMSIAKEHVDAIEPYKDLESWEDCIQKVVTVERKDGKMYVYLIMEGGEKVKQEGRVIRARAPNKLFDFYEQHLMWRVQP